jgi:DNA-directed RNA polymerase beta subunit
MSDFIDEKHIWEIIGNFFKTKGVVTQQIESFNNFINNGIEKVIKEEADIVIDDPKKNQEYRLHFENIYVAPPSIIEEDRKLKEIFPKEARDRDLNYDSAVHCDIEETLTEDGKIIEYTKHSRIAICRIPIMLLSDKCNLKALSKADRIKEYECEYDQGGYFIIRGNDRVLISQLRGTYNQVIVLKQKNDDKFCYTAEIRSMSEETGHSVLVKGVIVKVVTGQGVKEEKKIFSFSLPYVKDVIPAGIVFKALGYIKEEDIRNLIGCHTQEGKKLVNTIIRSSFFIEDQDQALKHIGQFAMHSIPKDKRRTYAWQVVETELFPHLGVSATILDKAIYLGHIMKKLINTFIGIRSPDDRDNHANKRVETAGVLCTELFRTLFKKYLNTIKAMLEKKKTRLDGLSIITRLNSITHGLKHSFCLAAGSMITLSNGLSVPIETLSNCSNKHEKVIGWNKDRLMISDHGGLVEQGIKDTVKLTMEDGRTLVCTPDHKILVLSTENKTEWVEANSIPIGSRLVCGLDNPVDNPQDDINNLSAYWSLKTDGKVWKVDTVEERNKTLAFMRILGYIICDGRIQEKINNSEIYLGSMVDVNNFLADYKLITGKNNVVIKDVDNGYGKIYSIRLCSELSKIIKSINGVVTGRKVTQEHSLPSFLLTQDCPKSVIREFLGGLFGADGYTTRLDIREGKRVTKRQGNKSSITGVMFSWTAEEKYLENLKDTFENICTLLNKVGVTKCEIYGPYTKDSAKDRHFYRIQLAANTEFNNNVGFRYCVHKSYRLCITSSYLRMIEGIKRQHDLVVDRTNEIKDSQKISVSKALDIARKELINKEYILNTYHSLSSTRDVYDRRGKNHPKQGLQKLQESHGVLDAKDYIDNMGILCMFTGEYANKREDIDMPYFSLKLVDIKKDKPQIVYDITNVKTCNSFLAGGVVCSNSTGNWGAQKNSYIRAGVSQVMSRLTYGATLSHCRRLVIPIGKEGKNAKIRQIHSSQFGAICPVETPEGASAGIVLNHALLAKVTKEVPTVLVKEVIEENKNIVFIKDIDLSELHKYSQVIVNGSIVGITENPLDLIEDIKLMKKNKRLDADISASYDPIDMEVKIYCDAGRQSRPLFTIGEDGKYLIKKSDGTDWNNLVRKNLIEYVDVAEVENSVIAMNAKDLDKHLCDYGEIHPSMMLGVMGATIPFADHSQAARNSFQSSMGKQAIGIYATSYKHRSDTIVHILDYPQRPLVSTKPAEFMGFSEMPFGVNAVVAIMCYSGWTSCLAPVPWQHGGKSTSQ